jgi:hypothetical protein
MGCGESLIRDLGMSVWNTSDGLSHILVTYVT